MKPKEYLELIGVNEKSIVQLTFIIGRAVKDENSYGHHLEYRSTPIRTVWEWWSAPILNEYYLLNEAQPPIDNGCGWSNWYNKGHLKCFLVIPKEDLEKLYPTAEQGLEWAECRAEDIRKRIK